MSVLNPRREARYAMQSLHFEHGLGQLPLYRVVDTDGVIDVLEGRRRRGKPFSEAYPLGQASDLCDWLNWRNLGYPPKEETTAT